MSARLCFCFAQDIQAIMILSLAIDVHGLVVFGNVSYHSVMAHNATYATPFLQG
jgi:hypothetical protein